MIKTEIKITYDHGARLQRYFFTGIIHKAESVDELKLDPISFYQKYNKIPTLPHFEIEIEDSTYNSISINKYFKMLHIHFTEEENKGSFVCWTDRIATIEKAIETFRLWSLGTVYTMNKGEDFAQLFYECKNVQEFENVMKNKGITAS